MARTARPETLQQAILFFSDYANCHRAVMEIRWPDGVVRCPHCGSENVTYLENQRRWQCYERHPKAQFSLKVGTIFEDSAIGLEKWLPALWLVTACKNGISSYELARALDVTQKTAWFMLSRLRLALQGKDGGKLSGDVEVDETFIGGKARNMHKSKLRRLHLTMNNPMVGKVAVMGVLERGAKGESKIRLRQIPSNRRRHVRPVIDEHIEQGSTIYSDSLKSYKHLSSADSEYVHNVIDHAHSYAEGTVHTNGMENFWSLLKRTLKGTYVSVEPFHLFRYLDEQAFRFNNRKGSDAMRFTLALKGILGKRLTYVALTGSELPQTC
jgi:transposase-like protein